MKGPGTEKIKITPQFDLILLNNNETKLHLASFNKIILNFVLIERNYSTYWVRWTVSVILSYPKCKDGKARFTMLPLKPLSALVCRRY